MPGSTTANVYDAARQLLGFDDEGWRLFVLDWGGFDDLADLERDDPSLFRGQRRVLDRLYVGGFRAGILPGVSPDYLCHVVWLRDACGLPDAELEAIVVATGPDPVGLGWPSMSGHAFRGVLAYFKARGHAIPDLSRSWMTPDRLAYLSSQRQAWKVGPSAFADMLVAFGGGVDRPDDLDEMGFDRVLVALETKAGAYAARASGRESFTTASDTSVRRLWPEWHRPPA